MSNMEQEKKGPEKEMSKKNNHTAGKVAGTALLLALLGGGGYFGLGVGNPDGGWLNPSPPALTQEVPDRATEATVQPTQAPTQPTTAEPQPTPTATEEAKELVITVREDRIRYQDREVTLEELEQSVLADYKEGKTVSLRDDHAIKSVYDEVVALMDRLHIALETESDRP